MAINPNLETISSGYNISKINSNFQAIDTALQDAVSRSGRAPNQMDADFDMNGNDILNVDNIDVNVLTINRVPVIVNGGVSVDPDSLVPVGGTDGQVLTKQSSVDYDVAWEDAATSVVTTRAALKALNTISITSVFLNESGREGVFFWKTGDYSTLITLDTREGVYIKADAIASTSGAWVRANKTNLTPYMFGAVGNGVTDDYNALQGYANVCGYIGSPFFITDTPESYAISAKIVLKVTRNLDPSDTTPASDVHFTDNLPFLVEGFGNAKLVATAVMDSMIEIIFDTVDSDIGPFYTTVRNIHFDGASLAVKGIKSDYTMHVTYENNRFQGLTRGIDYTGYGVFQARHNVFRCKYGIYLAGGGGDSLIEHNDFYPQENTSSGILFGYTSGNTVIFANTFSNVEGYTTTHAVQINGGLAPASEESRHIVVMNNEFSGYTTGVRIDGKASGNKNVWNIIVSGNHATPHGATNPGALIAAVDASDLVVENNFCNGINLIDATSVAMAFVRCERVVVRGNECADYLEAAVTLTDCVDTDITGNRFFNCGKTGASYTVISVFGSSSARNRIRRNVMRQSSASYAQLGVWEGTGVDGTTADNNDFDTIGTPYTKVGANSKMSVTVDNTVARYDGTTGALQASGVAISDGDNITNLVSSGQPYTGIMQNATNFAAGVELRKRGATGDANAALATSGEMGYHSFYGWDGSAYGRGSFVFVTTTQAWSVGAHGTQYQIYTTPNGSATNALALTVGQDGSVKLSQPLGGLGYNTGAGGAVTQGTSRTTDVTLNKVCGAITLFSAAGSTTYASFTVTNSSVAATDTIIVNQKSGTDLYEIHVTAIAAGSFRITFRTTGGTTVEQPVFNFSVIKATAS